MPKPPRAVWNVQHARLLLGTFAVSLALCTRMPDVSLGQSARGRRHGIVVETNVRRRQLQGPETALDVVSKVPNDTAACRVPFEPFDCASWPRERASAAVDVGQAEIWSSARRHGRWPPRLPRSPIFTCHTPPSRPTCLPSPPPLSTASSASGANELQTSTFHVGRVTIMLAPCFWNVMHAKERDGEGRRENHRPGSRQQRRAERASMDGRERRKQS